MVAQQAPPSLRLSRQEHWSGLPFPPMHESEKWKWSRSVVSNSLRPHGLQPTRLLCPWDSPGKSTGVGCNILYYTILYYLSHQVLHLCVVVIYVFYSCFIARWVDWKWLFHHDFYSLLQSSDRPTLQAAWGFTPVLVSSHCWLSRGCSSILSTENKTPQNLRVESYVLFHGFTEDYSLGVRYDLSMCTHVHTHTFLCMGRCRSLCSLKTSNYSFGMCLNYLGPVPCFSPILNSPQGGFTGSWLDGQQNIGTWMAGNILLFVYIFYWNDRWHFFFSTVLFKLLVFSLSYFVPNEAWHIPLYD